MADEHEPKTSPEIYRYNRAEPEIRPLTKREAEIVSAGPSGPAEIDVRERRRTNLPTWDELNKSRVDNLDRHPVMSRKEWFSTMEPARMNDPIEHHRDRPKRSR